MDQIGTDEAGNIDVPPDVLQDAAGPLAQALANMPDKDADFVIDECLKATQRAVVNGDGVVASWVDMWSVSGNQQKFDDLDMPELLQIVRYVLQESLAGFFRTIPSGSPTADAG